MEVFEQISTQEREIVPVGHVFPWRGGETFGASREDEGQHGLVTYYLPFEVGHDMHYIPFTRDELDACANPDNSQARFAVKKKILQVFKSLASEAQETVERHGMDAKEEAVYWLRQFEDICRRRGVTEEERDSIWQAMAYICCHQMREKQGAFYEALQPLREGKGEDTKTDPSLTG
jgi:hypothetical protein